MTSMCCFNFLGPPLYGNRIGKSVLVGPDRVYYRPPAPGPAALRQSPSESGAIQKAHRPRGRRRRRAGPRGAGEARRAVGRPQPAHLPSVAAKSPEGRHGTQPSREARAIMAWHLQVSTVAAAKKSCRQHTTSSSHRVQAESDCSEEGLGKRASSRLNFQIFEMLFPRCPPRIYTTVGMPGGTESSESRNADPRAAGGD